MCGGLGTNFGAGQGCIQIIFLTLSSQAVFAGKAPNLGGGTWRVPIMLSTGKYPPLFPLCLLYQ